VQSAEEHVLDEIPQLYYIMSIEQQLFDAAAEDDTADKIAQILNENPSIDINKQCTIFKGKKWKATPLYNASKHCNTDVVRILLNFKDIDVNAKSVAGETPLYVASKYDCGEVITLLLQNGANPNLADDFGHTPLHAASSINSQDAVDILLENGTDINIKENLLGNTPLFAALENGHIETADALLFSGADINIKNNNGETPLFVACKKGKIEIIDFVLSRGANIHVKNNYGLTCFDVANEEVKSVLKQWMTTMLVGVLQENNAYDSLDLKNIEDFNEYQGGKKRKRRSNKRKKRKHIKTRRKT
jgi:ankyrin repeat protein